MNKRREETVGRPEKHWAGKNMRELEGKEEKETNVRRKEGMERAKAIRGDVEEGK